MFDCKELKFKDKPLPRRNFGLCNNNELVYIYGGMADDQSRLDDFWELNGTYIIYAFLYLSNTCIEICILKLFLYIL